MLAPDSSGKAEEDVFARAAVAFFFFFPTLHLMHAFDLCLFPQRNMVFAFC